MVMCWGLGSKKFEAVVTSTASVNEALARVKQFAQAHPESA